MPQLKDIVPGTKLLVAQANPKESCLGLHVSWEYFKYHHIPEVHFLTLCAVFACLTNASYSGSFNYPYTAHSLQQAVASNTMNFWGHPGQLSSLSLFSHSISMWKLGFP